MITATSVVTELAHNSNAVDSCPWRILKQLSQYMSALPADVTVLKLLTLPGNARQIIRQGDYKSIDSIMVRDLRVQYRCSWLSGHPESEH